MDAKIYECDSISYEQEKKISFSGLFKIIEHLH